MSYWAKTYGPGEAKAVALAENGDVIIAGYAKKNDQEDAFVARLDGDGKVKWFKTYGGDKEDVFNDVKIAPNGDIIVAGATESFGAGKSDFWVLRLDENGNIKWQKTYGGSKWDGAKAVAIAENGDIIVAGWTESFGAGDADLWVLRLDENGNIKWQKTYGGSNSDAARSVAIAPNGDIIVAGWTTSFGAGSYDVWVLRLEGNGNVKWQKTYGGSDWDDATAVALAQNGDIIVAGHTESFGTGWTDFWLLRLDANGNVKWQKTYGGITVDWANAVAVAPNGDVIVAGVTASPDGDRDFWVLRLDSEGNVKWQKTYGGSDYDEANAVAIAPNGDIIVAGFYGATDWDGSGGDVWVLRLPPDGNLPGCEFCGDSSAQVSDSDAKVHDTKCEVLSGIRKYQVEVEEGRIFKKKRTEWRTERVSVKVMDSKATVEKERPSPETQYLLDIDVDKVKRQLSSALTVALPVLREGVGSTLKLTLTNDLADSLKATLDLSENNFLKLGRTKLEFQELKKGQKASRTVKIQPLKPGNFNLKIKVKAIVNGVELETEKIIPVKVEKLNLDQVLSVTVPPLTEALNSTIGFTINNDLADSLKATLNLSGNDFLKLEETELKFPKLGKGQEASKILKIQPLKPGNFNLKIKVKAIVNGVTLETEKTIPVKVEKLNLEEIPHVAFPQLVESIEAPLKLTLTNDLADSLKATLDLSENEFFELEETEVEFPELRKGNRIAKTVMVKPKYAGKFDFRIRIKALVNGLELEAEKVIPVEVAEKAATPAYITPQTPVTPATPQTPATPAPTPSPAGFPAQLAYRYTEVEPIGRGGFARVFKAKRKDGKVVAVKIPLSLDENTGKAFLREISHWLQLRHPNIVKLYDANILPIPFLEMEYCEGSLEKLPKPLPVEVASYIVFNIAEGLKYAHSKGIIHRDLKPSNVLLKDGIPKISDWGLSKAMAETHSTTLASFTPFYASPEQTSRRFGKPDHRSDIWQLGVIFYQLVTGKLPFEGDDLIEVVSRIATDEPVPPGELNSEAKEIEHIILTCLQKNPDDRYQSVAELQLELATYLGVRYKKELKRSITVNDTSRAAFYAGKLMLMFLKMGNMKEAYKYASDLKFYASGELSRDVEELAEGIKVRLEEGLSFAGEELLAKAEIIAHKVSLGFENL